jgi:tetratricopeptide (TPR) repeat protein
MSTLALNIIVGSGEAYLLNRCLTSYNAKNNFDEIVIVNTSKDKSINEVALKFTNKVFYYEWESKEFPYGNFGGARECARLNTESDKIWWLDADDVCLEQYKDKLIETIKIIKDDQYKNIDIWLMPYTIILNENGNPDVWFKRERVFDRKKIQWKKAVHEILFPPVELVQHAIINGMFNTHLPNKPTFVSANRNIKILESEYLKNKDDTQIKYFFGRDLMFIGEIEKGIKLLNEIIDEMNVGYEMLYAIAIEMIWFYAYGGINPHVSINQFRTYNIDKVENYCRLAISYTKDYAEPYVVLGDVYYYRGNLDAASKMYLTAMKKKIGKGKFQTQPFYNEIPADRLTDIFDYKGMIGMSLHYNDIAIKCNRKNEYLQKRKLIADKILKEIEK